MTRAAELRAALRCDRPRCPCRRGRAVHCPAHPDRSPSFVVDQDGEKLLVRCHSGCDQRTVIAALQARGLWPSSRPAPARIRSNESPLDAARREVLLEARRQLDHLPLVAYAWADELRWCYQLVALARRVATELRPCARAWNLLASAAAIERETLAAELAWDEDRWARAPARDVVGEVSF